MSSAATSLEAPGTVTNRRQTANPDKNSGVNGSSTSKTSAGTVSDGKDRDEGKTIPRKYRHVAALHRQSQPSCLSHDSTAAPSFVGFRNLMVIVLAVGNLRLMMENLHKYGVLICIRCHDFSHQDMILGIALYFLIPAHLFLAYGIEAWAARSAIASRRQTKDGSSSPTEAESRDFQTTWETVAALHGTLATLSLAVTSLVVYYFIHHPLIGTVTELHAIIVWLKTASYALTNRDLRHAYLHPIKGELAGIPELYASCPYPKNITFGNLVYFWWAPTLLYQPVYPRSERVRKTFVFKRFGEGFCLSVFIWFATAQYAAPVLQNSLAKIETLDLEGIVERVLKLSTISLVIWLAGFFALFQSFLNGLAEIMRFGDREFYDDWWNSPGFGTYWRTWNKPVTNFFKRHVYVPLIRRGWHPITAHIMVFFASAILHELLVGVPTHNIIGIAFLGMMVQIVLVAITQPFEGRTSPTMRLIGNTFFWVAFTIVGQPFAALMYFYFWQLRFGSLSKQIGQPQQQLH